MSSKFFLGKVSSFYLTVVTSFCITNLIRFAAFFCGSPQPAEIWMSSGIVSQLTFQAGIESVNASSIITLAGQQKDRQDKCFKQ